ncbi:MAG: alpha/beta fold hydrolase [Acidobacteriota bacterium]
MSKFEAGLDGVTFTCQDCRLIGGFYKAAGDTPRPTAILLHGLPGIEKHLDVAYRLRDLGWNCLYFHFRGSWGSSGLYSIAGLTEDTGAALVWTLKQPSVDKDRVVLIGASTGGHAAFLYAASDPRIRTIVGICPFIDPQAFHFPKDMADEFAGMLNGVTSQDLLEQWKNMPSLLDYLSPLASRALLLVTGDKDDLSPPSHYSDFVTALANVEWIRNQEADHGFSAHRTWLVDTITDWLVAQLGS